MSFAVARRLLSCGVLLTSALLGGCQAQTVPERELLLADWQLALKIPADWQVQQNLAGLRLLLRPLRKGQPWPGAYVALSRDEARLLTGPGAVPTLAGYVRFRQEQLGRNAWQQQLVRAETTTLDAVAAELWLRDIVSPTRRERVLSLMTVRNGQGYTLEAVAPAAEFSRLQAAYQRLAKGWRWLPSSANAVGN